MVDTQKKMYEGQPGVGDTLLYTAPAGGAIVRGIDVTNNTALDATITLALNSDGALIDATKFFSDFVIPAHGHSSWSGFQVLDSLQTIRGSQGTALALTITISGIEES